MGPKIWLFLAPAIACICMVILKLVRAVDWSWWTVTSPVWGFWIFSVAGLLLSIAFFYVWLFFIGRK